MAAVCEVVDPALEVAAKGDQKLQTIKTLVLSIASDRSGIKKKCATKFRTAALIP